MTEPWLVSGTANGMARQLPCMSDMQFSSSGKLIQQLHTQPNTNYAFTLAGLPHSSEGTKFSGPTALSDILCATPSPSTLPHNSSNSESKGKGSSNSMKANLPLLLVLTTMVKQKSRPMTFLSHSSNSSSVGLGLRLPKYILHRPVLSKERSTLVSQ